MSMDEQTLQKQVSAEVALLAPNHWFDYEDHRWMWKGNHLYLYVFNEDEDFVFSVKLLIGEATEQLALYCLQAYLEGRRHGRNAGKREMKFQKIPTSSNAPITDADREIARLTVSRVLKDEEAAWEPVAQLIADYRAECAAKRT